MPRSLNEYSWRTLRNFGDAAAAMFNVGDTKDAVLKDGTPVSFRIIGKKHDKTKSGLVLPLTWEMVDCMPNRYYWNERDTTEGSWPGTDLYKQMNQQGGRIFELFPDEIIDVAMPVLKLTSDTFGSGELVESEGQFFIKSEKEMFGRNIYSVGAEGHWYEFYRLEDVPYYKLRNGEREYTMLRSPVGAGTFCIVNTNGNANYNNSRYSYGLAPAFAF